MTSLKIIEFSTLIVFVIMMGVKSSMNFSTEQYLPQPTKTAETPKKVLNSLVNSALVLESSFLSNDLKHAIASLSDCFSGFSLDYEIGEVTSADRILRLKNSLDTWNHDIFQTAKKVNRLLNLLRLFELRRTLDAYGEDIENCFNLFEKNLFDPLSFRPYLKSCYGEISTYTVNIGKLLNGQSATLFNGNLFRYILDKTGYCDGTQISDMFKYILGVYSKGCLVTIAAEHLKFGTDNGTSYHQCQKIIKSSFSKFTSINENCEFQACDTIIKVLKTHSNESDVSVLSNRFRNIFPWYYFIVIYFNDEDISNIEFFGETINRLVLPDTGKVKKIIMWSQTPNKYTHGGPEFYDYGIRYPKALVKAETNQMNMTVKYTLGSAQVSLIGYKKYSKTGKIHSRCVSVPSTNDDEDDFVIKMLRWEMMVTFGSVSLFFAIVSYYVITC